MKKVIVITGTPCSGKTTVSEKVAKSIESLELINANDVVKRKRLFRGRSKNGELIVKMTQLRKELERRIGESKTDFVIIEGHLLCDFGIGGAVAIVIREHLKTLLKRMEKRGYGRKKIEDNIVSEAIDYCGVNATENYVEVYEVMGGPGAASSIVSILKGRKIKHAEIDMLDELNGIAKSLGKQII